MPATAIENHFLALIDPAATIRRLEGSRALEGLRSQVHRPLDRVSRRSSAEADMLAKFDAAIEAGLSVEMAKVGAEGDASAPTLGIVARTPASDFHIPGLTRA